MSFLPNFADVFMNSTASIGGWAFTIEFICTYFVGVGNHMATSHRCSGAEGKRCSLTEERCTQPSR